MTVVFIGPAFFKSMSQGWLYYYKGPGSSGPTFTEEQIRMADHAAEELRNCFPIDDLIDPITHSTLCKSLRNEKFTTASLTLEVAPQELNLSKAGCLEALKIGVWLLGTCAPNSIRSATLNLLACDHYFPFT